MNWLQRGYHSLKGVFRRKPSSALARVPYKEKIKHLNNEQLFRAMMHDFAQKDAKPMDLIPVFLDGRPRWPEWNSAVAIDRGFKGSSWVYIGAMKNANALSLMPWNVEKRVKGRWIHEPDHPAQKLINNPNPWTSRQHLIMLMVLELMITGNNLIGKVRVGGEGDTDGEITELVSIRSHRIATITNEGSDKLIDAYEITAEDGRRVECPAENIVHTMLPDPDDRFWGLSPLQACMRAFETDREAGDWQKVSFQNMLVPPGVFSFEKAIDESQFQQAQEKLRTEYQGALNANKPMLLGNGVTFTPLAMTSEEVDFIQTRQMTKSEILATLGVPLQIVDSTDSTFSNADTARRVWWEDTLFPLAGLIGGALLTQLVSEFSDIKVEQYRVVPDTSMVHALLVAINEKLDAALKLQQLGYTTNQINERLALGMPDIEWGNQGFVPSSLVPADTLIDGDF